MNQRFYRKQHNQVAQLSFRPISEKVLRTHFGPESFTKSAQLELRQALPRDPVVLVFEFQ